MIELSRLNGKKFLLNAELVESVEAMPDTTIRLTSGKTYVVREGCEEVREALLQYRRSVIHGSGGRGLPRDWTVIDSDK